MSADSPLVADLQRLSTRWDSDFTIARTGLAAESGEASTGLDPRLGPFADADVVLLRKHLAGRRRTRSRSVL
ncbi:MAG TPA: hypothetical protein VLR26_07845 [Frankiaceae bacterium]|nr:hypothetical protein [Frankiaceae bacterium]